MKPSSRSGFTLIELLVVIAIIAILASIVTVSATGAINAAKRAKAANMATQINTAIINFYTEYGTYPTATSGTDTTYTADSSGGGSEQAMMFALCGNINPYNPQPAATSTLNPREIAYLSPKKSEVDTNGVPITPFSAGTTYGYYGMAMDSSYDGIIAAPDFADATSGSQCPPTNANITQGAAVWACCDPKYISNPGASTSPQFWVHTY